MQVLKYKLFKSTEEFEQFQRNNKIGITQIQPMFQELKTNEKEGTAKLDLNIFVVYFDKKEMIKEFCD